MKKLYVGNLPFRLSEDELREAFAAHGNVTSAVIVLDRETQRSRGFGFVEMDNDDDADKAIEQMNGADLAGRTLVVNEARPREDRFGGGGGRRGGGGGGGGRPGGGGGRRGGGDRPPRDW